MKDDWKPVRKGGFPGGVRKTFRDGKGNPYHYNHNEGKFVEGMYKSSAALNTNKKKKKEDDNKNYGKLL